MKTEIRCKVELREDATLASPGRVTGTLLRYGDPGQQGREVFQAGALSWPEEGVVLNEQHNRQAPIVRFVPTVEGNEVRVDVELPDTQRGRDAATSVRNGTLRGLSVRVPRNQGAHGQRCPANQPGRADSRGPGGRSELQRLHSGGPRSGPD